MHEMKGKEIVLREKYVFPIIKKGKKGIYVKHGSEVPLSAVFVQTNPTLRDKVDLMIDQCRGLKRFHIYMEKPLDFDVPVYWYGFSPS